MGLDRKERALVGHLEARQGPMETELAALVAQNSFTPNREGVNAVGDHIQAELQKLGFRVAELVTGGVGRSLVARRSGYPTHRLLLLRHLASLPPPTSSFSSFVGGPAGVELATGPGVADMKGGLVVVLEALRALAAAPELDGRQISIVFNADEETGSASSADLIRAGAQVAGLCRCFVAGRMAADGKTTFVTERKGFGRMKLVATGRAAHAGVDPAAGASAVLELAHKIPELHALADPALGTTVNVGLFRGGTTANTVPEEAMLELDYRFPDEDTQLELEDALIQLSAKNFVKGVDGKARVATVLKEHVKRPAMKASEASERMSARLVKWGADLGLSLVPESRGGSSDAAFAADLGCPTICGLGAVGGAFHTDQEWIQRRSLVDRSRLLALTMYRFFRL